MPRQLDVGTTLQRVFETYRRRWASLLPAALLVFAVVDLLSALVLSRGDGAGLAVASLAISVVGGFWFQGVVVDVVRRDRGGEPALSVGRMFSVAAPRVAPLIGVGMLAALGITIGALLLVIPGLILLTWWSLVVPVVVLEPSSPALDAFSRSRELVRGSGWQVFGIVLFVLILEVVVSSVFGGIAGSDFTARWIASLLTSTLVMPVGALASSTMYFELRAASDPNRCHA